MTIPSMTLDAVLSLSTAIPIVDLPPSTAKLAVDDHFSLSVPSNLLARPSLVLSA